MKQRLCQTRRTASIRRWTASLLLASLTVVAPCLAQAARQVTLAWDANVESTVAGYRVFCRQAGEVYNYSHPIWDGTATTCTLIGLDDYADYAFVVRAYDDQGHESADSDEVWLAGLIAAPQVPEATAPVDDAPDLFLTPVLQTVPFISGDVGDTHLQTQWVITRISDGLCVLDVTSANQLTELDVPPLVLEENTSYSWVVRYTSAKGGLSDWSTPYRFTTGLSALDADGNGIPDDQEVSALIDLDDNGIADADQEDLRCVNVLDGAGQMAVYLPNGSGVTRISAIEATDIATIGGLDQLPFDLPLGLISFRLEMDHVGGVALIRVHFSEPAPDTAAWLKYDFINGWQDYAAHAAFSIDRLSAEIEIQDGGFGDADGVANGIIIDPSGFGIAPGDNDPTDDTHALGGSSASASGGGCFLSVLGF